MGIYKLWNIIDQCGETIEISRFAAAHVKREKRTLRIAVDEASWRFKTFVPIKKAGAVRADLGKGQSIPEFNEQNTRTSIQKLLNSHIQLIFVADGTPPIEKGRGSKTSQFGRQQQKSLKKVLEELNVPWHQAPGEAEAECAYMQKWGIVDAVWTEDGDAFMFGCTSLIRFSYRTNKTKHSHKIRVYKAQHIKTRFENLDRFGFVLFACLSGGDYAQKLPKCTPLQALRAVNMNLGKELCEAKTKREFEMWRNNLAVAFQMLRYEVEIPMDFPSERAVYLYNHPVTSMEEDLRALATTWFPIMEANTSFEGDGAFLVISAVEESTLSTTLETEDASALSTSIDTKDSPSIRKRKFPIFDDDTQKNASNEKQNPRRPPPQSESGNYKSNTQHQKRITKSQRMALYAASPSNKLCFRQSKPSSQLRAKDSLSNSQVPLLSNPDRIPGSSSSSQISTTPHKNEKENEKAKEIAESPKTQPKIQSPSPSLTNTNHPLSPIILFTSSPSSHSSPTHANPEPTSPLPLPLPLPTRSNSNSYSNSNIITYEYPPGVFTEMDIGGVFSSSPAELGVVDQDGDVNVDVDGDEEIPTSEISQAGDQEMDIKDDNLSAREEKKIGYERKRDGDVDGDENREKRKTVIRYPEAPVGPYLEMEMDFEGFFSSSLGEMGV